MQAINSNKTHIFFFFFQKANTISSKQTHTHRKLLPSRRSLSIRGRQKEKKENNLHANQTLSSQSLYATFDRQNCIHMHKGIQLL